MTSRELRDRLSLRLSETKIEVSHSQLDQLIAYYELLRRWNRRINLTALPLDKPTPDTLDRLFIEPLAAACLFTKTKATWIDIGSGGGSPAVPLKIVRAEATLTMVESRARKAAFLREVVRTVGLDAAVENVRLADLATMPVDVVTARAVRTDEDFENGVSRLLRADGLLLLFYGLAKPELLRFRLNQTVQLPTNYDAFVTAFTC